MKIRWQSVGMFIVLAAISGAIAAFALSGCAYWEKITASPADTNSLVDAGGILLKPIVHPTDVNNILAIADVAEKVGDGLIALGYAAWGGVALGFAALARALFKKKGT